MKNSKIFFSTHPVAGLLLHYWTKAICTTLYGQTLTFSSPLIPFLDSSSIVEQNHIVQPYMWSHCTTIYGQTLTFSSPFIPFLASSSIVEQKLFVQPYMAKHYEHCSPICGRPKCFYLVIYDRTLWIVTTQNRCRRYKRTLKI